MIYTSLLYSDLSTTQRSIFFNFLKETHEEIKQSAHENMWDDNWQNKNNTLPYILENTNRFRSKGEYNILFDNNTVVAAGGVYISPFCSELAIAGTRTWINKDYRNKSIAREYLLPAHKKWAIENGCKAVALTFNDYNKNIIKTWKRIRLGESRVPRKAYHIFYKNFIELPFPVSVQYTSQWLIYEQLDASFNFDWTSIRLDNN